MSAMSKAQEEGEIMNIKTTITAAFFLASLSAVPAFAGSVDRFSPILAAWKDATQAKSSQAPASNSASSEMRRAIVEPYAPVIEVVDYGN